MSHISIEQLSKDARLEKGVATWDIWEKEPSTFPYEYDSEEQFYIDKGDAVLTTEAGESYHIKKGDFVTIPKGFSCTWTINKTVKKHYRFV